MQTCKSNAYYISSSLSQRVDTISNLRPNRSLRSLFTPSLPSNSGRAWAPGDLTNELRREWVRVMARTHTDMNYEHRLRSALKLCEHLVEALPVTGFKVEIGGGGNWDDDAIERIVARLGFTLRIKPQTYSDIKRKVRDDLGSLGLVKKLRNSLAHGSISFAECGENITVSELRDLTNRIAVYMREVVQAFATYIEDHRYLVPAKRQAKVGS